MSLSTAPSFIINSVYNEGVILLPSETEKEATNIFSNMNKRNF
jgi:hypothetical protein